MNRRIFIKSGIYAGLGFFFAESLACTKDEFFGQSLLHPAITPSQGIDLYGSILDDKRNPVPGVVISDGYTCVQTDEKGIYQMKRNPKALIVYYSVPEKYTVNTFNKNIGMASFFSRLTTNKRYNFDLKKLSEIENDFTLVAIGDPQVKNAESMVRYKNETIPDLKEFVKSAILPCYGIVLGDTVQDRPEFFIQMREVTGSVNIPYFTTIGNHDKTGGSESRPRHTTVFTSTFGPVNYSWNRGKVHFVSLDNVLYSSNSKYSGGFEDHQIKWLKQDLSYVPRNKMIIVYYHIPMRHDKFDNRSAFFEALQEFDNIHLMCGHTHYHENYHITSPRNVHEHIHGAVCGSWWNSTINTDGTPNGYMIYQVHGTELKSWYYKAVNHAKDFQIRMHKGNTRFGGQYGYFSYNRDENIIANIWNADSEWTIEAYEDNAFAGNPIKLSNIIDAFAAGYHVGELNKKPNDFRAMLGRESNKHAYLHTIRNKNAQIIEIRAIDRFGVTYSQTEIIKDLATAKRY